MSWIQQGLRLFLTPAVPTPACDIHSCR